MKAAKGACTNGAATGVMFDAYWQILLQKSTLTDGCRSGI
jgi:hypothetical protein